MLNINPHTERGGGGPNESKTDRTKNDFARGLQLSFVGASPVRPWRRSLSQNYHAGRILFCVESGGRSLFYVPCTCMSAWGLQKRERDGGGGMALLAKLQRRKEEERNLLL